MMPAVRQATMGALNESLVLDYVREHPGTSRTDIARDLGLSAASVSRITGRLIREGAVTETPQPSDGRGRPASRLSFDPRSGCVLALDLGGTKCHGVLADLAGGVLAEDIRDTSAQGTAVETLVASIDVLTRAAPSPLVAAAIGVPAILDPSSGVAVESPNLHWRGLALTDVLREHIPMPFVVDNDVKLSALGHAWRGSARGLSDFATISIGTGIGAAIVANGELVRGRHAAAGEVAYLILHPTQLAERDPNGHGGLERLISGPAIARRARELLAQKEGAQGSLDRERLTSGQVLVAAQAGHPVARQVVDEVIETLGLALLALAVATDPELIILDGGVGRSLEPYLGRLQAMLEAQLPWVPRLEVSRLGQNAAVVGAIATALWLDRQRGMPDLRRRTLGTHVVHAVVG